MTPGGGKKKPQRYAPETVAQTVRTLERWAAKKKAPKRLTFVADWRLDIVYYGLKARLMSGQQKKVLAILARTAEGQLPSEFLWCILYGVVPRGRSSRPPLTVVQRASFSRTIKRLKERGMIERPHTGLCVLTEAGRAAAKRLTIDANWIQTLTLSPSTFAAWFTNGPTAALAELESVLSTPSSTLGGHNR